MKRCQMNIKGAQGSRENEGFVENWHEHWDHPTVYPMILKLLITRGNITLIPKEATQKKRKRKFKITTRKIEKERKRRIKIRKKMINTPSTRGE